MAAERVAVAIVANYTTHIDKESVMMKRTLMVSALATVMSLSAGFALAADQAPAQEKAQTHPWIEPVSPANSNRLPLCCLEGQ